MLTCHRQAYRLRRTAPLWGVLLLVSVSAAEQLSLDGDWHFLTDPSGKAKVQQLASAKPRMAKVPGSWQSQFPDLRDYAGVCWYWRTVSGRKPGRGEVVLLRFGAVDYRAQVFVNGKPAGRHEGGYLPFEVDAAPYWRGGENTVALRVADAGPAPEVEGIRFEEIPHGKQNWYVQTSGPWQSVTLEYRPRVRLGVLHVRTEGDRVSITAALAGGGAAGEALAVIQDASGHEVWRQQQAVGADGVKFHAVVAHAARWSPESPVLYTATVRLSSGDVASTRFGFRTIAARDGKLLLNNSPIYLRCALDQDFYPETIYTPPSLDYVRDELRKARALGLNCLRYHIKVADPRYLDAADETGVLIWYDLPNWDRLTEDAKRRGMETMRATVERDWNHPSIVIYTIINEAWGMDVKEPAHRAWLKQAYAETKAAVPGWLVVDNSPCCDNYHLKSDVADFHQYNAIPDHAAMFRQVVDDLASRARWLYSPAGDAEFTGKEPLVLSEFGNWGLPHLPALKPWWWSRRFKNNEITLPEGVEQRFTQYGFQRMFPSFDALAEATQQHQFRALKYEIETLRSHPEIQGYVITEFTDLNWEANGLLDMWRNPKSFARELVALQHDDLVVARATKRNYISGERVSAEVFLSHYGAGSWPAGEVRWSFSGGGLRGTLPAGEMEQGSTAAVGRVDFIAPMVSTPERRELVLEAAAGGRVLARNTLEFFVYPRSIPDDPPPVRIHDPGGRLRSLAPMLRLRNYPMPPPPAEAVLVASYFDEEARQTLAGGGRVLLLPAERQSLSERISILPRANSNLDGNWITGFLWRQQASAPFRTISFTPLAGFEVENSAPDAVVSGLEPGDFNDVLSGIFYGWIHSNAGTVVQAKYGRGRLIVCTYPLGTAYGSDPYATYLFDALVQYASSDFAPSLDLTPPTAGN